ncbi:unnamed protein product [Larinioides sclopetarius]|uniref:Ribosomal protein S14 n=1 Tax=Larinioides sclopetarius TaxID=280406 RepID=A0AAV1Z058_9ARAC
MTRTTDNKKNVLQKPSRVEYSSARATNGLSYSIVWSILSENQMRPCIEASRLLVPEYDGYMVSSTKCRRRRISCIRIVHG